MAGVERQRGPRKHAFPLVANSGGPSGFRRPPFLSVSISFPRAATVQPADSASLTDQDEEGALPGGAAGDAPEAVSPTPHAAGGGETTARPPLQATSAHLVPNVALGIALVLSAGLLVCFAWQWWRARTPSHRSSTRETYRRALREVVRSTCSPGEK